MALANSVLGSDNRVVNAVGAVYVVNRFEALLAYNVGYLSIVLAIAFDPSRILGRAGLLAVFFAAVLLAKGEASIADALHDYHADKQNPGKSYVSRAVDAIGWYRAAGLLVLQVLLSFVACVYLTVVTGHWIFVFAAIWGNFIGFFYSYWPRFKERGVLNHLITSTGDLVCVLIPGAVLLVDAVRAVEWLAIAVVGFYSFAFHVMHQAADTYYDRQAGLDTFTQAVGVDTATLLSAGASAVAAVLAFGGGLLVVGLVSLAFSLFLLHLARTARGKSEKRQTDVVADRFAISFWATALNLSTASSLVALELGLVPGGLSVAA